MSLALDGKTTTTLTPKQLAPMLQLPREPGAAPALGGAAANAYFARLDQQVGRPAHGATFAVSGDQVHVVPAVDGLALDVPRSAAAVLTAALRTDNRVAGLVVHRTHTGRTTAAAQAMGITGQVSSYETIYGGIANRIHNVQLVAHLVDDKLIAPGATFSFNGATGERSAAKGFVEAPVIINGELSTGLGGGVCQVSTTVFNAAYEAGLPITARTNHALYISHYPLGRDATVDYPDIDLKFVNDTPHWLLLRTFVGSSSLVVALYGTPVHRRVVSQTSPLRVVSPAPVYRSIDSSLAPGERVVDAYGTPAQSTSVRRLVYAPDGKLLSDSTWYSSYRAEPTVIRIGPKKPKKPKAPPAAKTGGKGQAGAAGATGAAGPLAGQAAGGAGAAGADATGIDATGTGSSTTGSTTTGSTTTGSTTTGSTTTDSTNSASTATGSTATGTTGSTAATTGSVAGTSSVSPAGAR